MTDRQNAGTPQLTPRLMVGLFGTALILVGGLSVIALPAENQSKYFYAVAAGIAGAHMWTKPEWYL